MIAQAASLRPLMVNRISIVSTPESPDNLASGLLVTGYDIGDLTGALHSLQDGANIEDVCEKYDVQAAYRYGFCQVVSIVKHYCTFRDGVDSGMWCESDHECSEEEYHYFSKHTITHEKLGNGFDCEVVDEFIKKEMQS